MSTVCVRLAGGRISFAATSTPAWLLQTPPVIEIPGLDGLSEAKLQMAAGQDYVPLTAEYYSLGRCIVHCASRHQRAKRCHLPSACVGSHFWNCNAGRCGRAWSSCAQRAHEPHHCRVTHISSAHPSFLACCRQQISVTLKLCSPFAVPRQCACALRECFLIRRIRSYQCRPSLLR